jgi:nucleotide-binding universal stress UspA family protein
MMARDRELPAPFAALNNWGMPLVPLVLSTLVPLFVVLWVADVGHLADLYAIGVVGAVAINLGSCCTNRDIALGKFERAGMALLSMLMIGIWITIAIEKPHALIFAMTIMGAGMAARWTVRNRSQIRSWVLAPVQNPLLTPATIAPSVTPPLQPRSKTEPTRPRAESKPPVRRIMVATGGSVELFLYALNHAKAQNAELFVLFIRHLAIATMGSSNDPDAALDPEAVDLFGYAATQAAEAGMPVHCLYALAWDVADAILDFAVTYGVDELVLGASKRGALWHTMKGDVIQGVAEYLPERINLLIHA